MPWVDCEETVREAGSRQMAVINLAVVNLRVVDQKAETESGLRFIVFLIASNLAEFFIFQY